MKTKVDEAAANRNALRRALRMEVGDQSPPRLPERPLIGERLADHGTDSGRDVRKSLADELNNLCRQVERIRGNPTKSGAQQEIDIDDAVQSRANELLARCEAEREAIAREEQAVDLGMDAALRSPSPTLDSEYRAVLRGMTDEQRWAFIEREMKGRGASALRYAIGAVPPELSGASFGKHAEMRDALLALHDPTLLTRPRDLAARKASIAKAEDGIRRTVAELTDSDRAKAIRDLTKEA